MAIAAAIVLLGGLAIAPVEARGAAPDERSGEELYRGACAHCHGVDGRGADRSRLSLARLPDFTDCGFATREPDGDWAAVVHEGGPARAFDRTMPAFGGALTDDEVRRVLGHVRSFCAVAAWPRGELNLPRPLITEKAFPEDELVVTTAVAAEDDGAVTNKVVYERRFGSRNQVEIVVPIAAHDGGPDGWRGGIGDIALGVKRALYHNHLRGSIVSLTGEVKLPTGDEASDFGKGVAVFEPFVTFGQILPNDGFVHFQGGVELPTDTDRAVNEAFWRTTVGRSFTQGRFGRTWSPMVELVGARELVAGEGVQWDLVPQVQVTLSTRQHVMVNLGVRVPITDAGPRPTEVLMYFLWDWFDGGLVSGW
jgi:mono/diheme cytochrome c family protein